MTTAADPAGGRPGALPPAPAGDAGSGPIDGTGPAGTGGSDSPVATATVGSALAQARSAGVGRLDALWLLGALLQRPTPWLLAHDDEPLDAAQAGAWAAGLRRRAAGEPLAYVVGHTTFCGLKLGVSPAVLIPRPETEELVRWASERLQHLTAAGADQADGGRAGGEERRAGKAGDDGAGEALRGTGRGAGGSKRPRASVDPSAPGAAPRPAVVDLGTGSGAVALALARHWPSAVVTATDASDAALAVARANARALGVAVEFVAGSWWEPLAGRRFDLVLSNPPYVAVDDPHLAALAHEPASALTPGGDGLSALHAIVDGAPAHLHPGGWLLLEHGHDQAEAVRARLQARGFDAVATRCDLAGLPRCSGGRWVARARGGMPSDGERS